MKQRNMLKRGSRIGKEHVIMMGMISTEEGSKTPTFVKDKTVVEIKKIIIKKLELKVQVR